MKRYFNIKKISFIVLSLICFLMINDKVDAEYTLSCNYVIPTVISGEYSHQECEDSDCKKFWNDYVIQLNVKDNSKWEFGFYNNTTKKFDSSESGENNTFYSHDLWINSSSTTLAFDLWGNVDYENCPIITAVYDTTCSYPSPYTGEGNCMTIYPYVITEQGSSNHSELRQVADYCAKNKNHCVTPTLVSSNNKKEDGSGSISVASNDSVTCNDNYLFSCNYASLSDSDTKTKFTMHVNNSAICFDNYDKNLFGTDKNLYPYALFRTSDLNGDCPNVLYGKSSADILSLGLKSYSDGTYDWKFGRKVSIDELDNDTSKEHNIKNGKTIEYIKKAYSLIRFIVPVLIIAFSIIDFAGVVISGESDKMEKAKKKFIVRLIIGVAFIMIPFILEVLLRVSGILGSGENLADVVYNIIN